MPWLKCEYCKDPFVVKQSERWKTCCTPCLIKHKFSPQQRAEYYRKKYGVSSDSVENNCVRFVDESQRENEEDNEAAKTYKKVEGLFWGRKKCKGCDREIEVNSDYSKIFLCSACHARCVQNAKKMNSHEMINFKTWKKYYNLGK